MGTITLTELKSNGYARAKEFANHEHIIDLINYVDFLNMNNGLQVKDIDFEITDPNSAGQKPSVLTTKKQLNKIYFTHVEENKIEPEKTSISKEIFDEIKSTQEIIKKNKISELERLKKTIA